MYYCIYIIHYKCPGLIYSRVRCPREAERGKYYGSNTRCCRHLVQTVREREKIVAVSRPLAHRLPPPPSPTLGRSCRDGPYPTRPGLTENSPSLSSHWQMIGQSRTRGRIQNGRRPFGGPDWPATIPPTNRTAGSVIFFAGKEGPGRNTLCAADVMTAPELFWQEVCVCVWVSVCLAAAHSRHLARKVLSPPPQTGLSLTVWPPSRRPPGDDFDKHNQVFEKKLYGMN